jgi:hypothetical protein
MSKFEHDLVYSVVKLITYQEVALRRMELGLPPDIEYEHDRLFNSFRGLLGKEMPIHNTTVKELVQTYIGFINKIKKKPNPDPIAALRQAVAELPKDWRNNVAELPKELGLKSDEVEFIENIEKGLSAAEKAQQRTSSATSRSKSAPALPALPAEASPKMTLSEASRAAEAAAEQAVVQAPVVFTDQEQEFYLQFFDFYKAFAFQIKAFQDEKREASRAQIIQWQDELWQWFLEHWAELNEQIPRFTTENYPNTLKNIVIFFTKMKPTVFAQLDTFASTISVFLQKTFYDKGWDVPSFTDESRKMRHWKMLQRMEEKIHRRRINDSEMPYEIKQKIREGHAAGVEAGYINSRVCNTCGAEKKADGSALAVCSGCKKVSYCCPECQKKDWPSHKADCKKWTEREKPALETRMSRKGGRTRRRRSRKRNRFKN